MDLGDLIEIGAVVITGGTFLFIYLRNQRVNNATGNLLQEIQKGRISFDEIAVELGMFLRSRDVNSHFTEADIGKVDFLQSREILEKFKVLSVQKKGESERIVIAKSYTPDYVRTDLGDADVAHVLPCLLYIYFDAGERKVICKTSMPTDREHRYLLDDLAEAALDLICT